MTQVTPVKPKDAPDAQAVQPDTPAPIPSQASPPKRVWNDAPLHVKVYLLVALAAVGGNLVGLMEVGLGQRIWPMLLGLAAVTGGVWWLGRGWVIRPFRELLSRVDQVDWDDRPAAVTGLPVDREDEVGRLARVVGQVAARGTRDYHEAKRLRRSMDKGVEQATHRATIQLRQMVMQDPLTGLGNRRFLEEHLEVLFETSWTSGTPLACVAIDMDNFKQVNDTLGHAAGDELLKVLGILIRGSVRHEDYGVRLGGDEFLVLLPGGDADIAHRFSHRLVSLFRQHVRTVMPGQVRADLSVGVAVLGTDMASAQHLLDAADKNLYAAKRAGKGRIISGSISQ